jgi:hypothetical protein
MTFKVGDRVRAVFPAAGSRCDCLVQGREYTVQKFDSVGRVYTVGVEAPHLPADFELVSQPAPAAASAYPDDNPKTVYGTKKPPLSLIPAPALIELSVAMGLGAKKYGAYNWREKTVSTSIYVEAAMRHLLAYFDGEDTDPESGASHLGHVMACCAIVLDAKAIGKINDNRPTPGAFGQLSRDFAERAQ